MDWNVMMVTMLPGINIYRIHRVLLCTLVRFEVAALQHRCDQSGRGAVGRDKREQGILDTHFLVDGGELLFVTGTAVVAPRSGTSDSIRSGRLRINLKATLTIALVCNEL
jgi:hypothetical protein